MHRNEIVFGGRSGFARLAIDQKVPIVPIVTAGAGESALVLTDGKSLAKALRLDKLLRIKALPISVSLPWGVSVGFAGMAPYLPLPSKLQTTVLPEMKPRRGEAAAAFADRVQAAMQDALTAMTAMTATTLNQLSNGRFKLGIGPSGPQVIEGWHGVPYGKPLTRTREAVAIIRAKRNGSDGCTSVTARRM